MTSVGAPTSIVGNAGLLFLAGARANSSRRQRLALPPFAPASCLQGNAGSRHRPMRERCGLGAPWIVPVFRLSRPGMENFCAANLGCGFRLDTTGPNGKKKNWRERRMIGGGTSRRGTIACNRGFSFPSQTAAKFFSAGAVEIAPPLGRFSVKGFGSMFQGSRPKGFAQNPPDRSFLINFGKMRRA